MGLIMDGKPVSEQLAQNIKDRVSICKDKGIIPTILLIRVGSMPDDVAYENSIVKKCAMLGIRALSDPLDISVNEAELVKHIKRANEDGDIHGIMIFKPLPSNIDPTLVGRTISAKKDVDGISDINLLNVFKGNDAIAPCTSKAVILMLKHYDVDLVGKNVVIIGRSEVVSKPLAMLLLNENATVTICHSKTEQLDKITRHADIVVTAIGKPRFFGKKYFTEKSVVIDVGISFDKNRNKLSGDVAFDKVSDIAAAITPQQGGVGAITTMVLLDNLMHAIERSNHA